jgi:hypothetical protein
MASSTNPRVRRLNQMIRVRNTENMPMHAYFGKPTITAGFGSDINTYHPTMQNQTTKTLLEWNYNQYDNRYDHLYPEDNSGLNNYKIGQPLLSHNLDKVDKSFKDKKLQSSIKKNILMQGNKPHSWMRKQVHGDPNSYSSFKDIFEHRYLHNVNNPWPEGDVGYGPFNRLPSGGSMGSRSDYGYDKRAQSVQENRSRGSNGGTPLPRSPMKAGQGSRINIPDNMNNTFDVGDQAGQRIGDNTVFHRTGPAHADEGYLPSYGINHGNILCEEPQAEDGPHRLEKVTNGSLKPAHLDEDYMPSYEQNYIPQANLADRRNSQTPSVRSRQEERMMASARSMDKPRTGKKFARPDYRLGDDGRHPKNKANFHNEGRTAMNLQGFLKSQLNPNVRRGSQRAKTQQSENVRIKDRELAHGPQDRGMPEVNPTGDDAQKNGNNWENPVIFDKRYNGHLPFTGYVDPAMKQFYRKRVVK